MGCRPHGDHKLRPHGLRRFHALRGSHGRRGAATSAQPVVILWAKEALLAAAIAWAVAVSPGGQPLQLAQTTCMFGSVKSLLGRMRDRSKVDL